ncbi:IclR family transcriptional regulator [Lampropedia puyangensis]|uniref:IclR family transcriptional regulator n=1 Tax=Lampropedia puyangensis TaxID=1330072 RepID=A0A4S8FBU6_9BURK|nr:IclR family transcriptional regulator [Lampropedia puyangensis]THU05050.1 IclR family transcriptional regulator [Lampropedia puyangensis]
MELLPKKQEGAQSVRRALAVLRVLAAGQEHGVRLLDVAKATGFNRATVHRLLQVMMEEGAVEQDPSSRKYLIGSEVSLMGMARTARFPIRSVAVPQMRTLSEKEGETSFLTIRSGDDSVCIARELGSFMVKVLSIEVGARRPLGVGVSGLVLLAALDDEHVDDIIERNASKLSNMGITADALRERVVQTRQKGYAFAPIGVVPYTRALAVPVYSPAAEVVAGLAVTAVSNRLPERRLPSLVNAMAMRAQAIGEAWARQEGSRRHE